MFSCGRKHALLAAAALAASLLTIFSTAETASADDACRAQVDYTVVNDWGSGFQAQVAIANTGETAIDGWRLTLTYPAPITVSNPGWGIGGPIQIDPYTIAFTGTSWNDTIAPGGTTGLGFAASGGGGAPSAALTGGGEDCDLGDAATDEAANPYAGADVYVNPEWSAQAAGGGAPDAIAAQPTAVWLDSIGAVIGDGDRMGLAGHLDEALAQGADLVQIVLYDLPGRDCAALSSDGELGPEEIAAYEYDFVDPIAAIIGDPAYADLDVAAVVEPHAIPDLAAHTDPSPSATPECNAMRDNGNYMEGIAYAVTELAEAGVYNYLDAGDHARIGWHDANPAYDEFGNAVDLFGELLTVWGVDPGDITGIAANTAGYAATAEPYFDVDDVVSGVPVDQTPWVDFNSYIDEQGFTFDLRNELVAAGFDADLGVLVDTSRNGWGGPDRPTETSDSTDPVTYVDESRIDRRISKQYRCNQAGAGLGARPQAEPTADPHLHAYAWIQPPGLSDGTDEPDSDAGHGFDSTCTPEYGSLEGAPPRGEWFQGQFSQLLANAWPPLAPAAE